MTIHTYCRRSKNDEGKQQFSLDVQEAGCTEMIARMGLADHPRPPRVDDGRAGNDFLTRSGLRELLTDAQRGDVIVCRDQSRLGRDAIEVTLSETVAAAKYPLTGIAKCGTCGGAIAATRVRAFGGTAERVKAYGCARHHERGQTVCAVTVHQPMADVEAALIEHLQRHVLSEAVLQMVLGEIRNEIAAQAPQREADLSALEADLHKARAEQKRLAQAVAMVDDVPELVAELKQRSARIQNLQAQLLAAKRTPAEMAALVERIEDSARRKLGNLHAALADQRDLREVFLALFPNGLQFAPTRTPDDSRQVWKISGSASYGSLVDQSGPERIATPTGFEPVLPA
jgi:cell division protein ZapA (FtsZ GTPase activity inhibitor)